MMQVLGPHGHILSLTGGGLRMMLLHATLCYRMPGCNAWQFGMCCNIYLQKWMEQTLVRTSEVRPSPGWLDDYVVKFQA
jgi:hypothetical protein